MSRDYLVSFHWQNGQTTGWGSEVVTSARGIAAGDLEAARALIRASGKLPAEAAIVILAISPLADPEVTPCA